ncbi:MAG: sensor histidine kinase [Dethiobacteria bacterium]
MSQGNHLAGLLLSGIAAAMGAYLACYSTGNSRWIGFFILLTGAALLALLAMEARGEKKKIEALHGQLVDFLEGRLPSPHFSVDDDDFALLENAVVELENRLLQEQEKARLETQKNAAFIADISHQLKTPLAALRLYSELEQARLEPTGETKTVAGRERGSPGEYIHKQLALIERMEKLIYSLLRLEKLRADAYEMHFADHDLHALAWEVWAELQPLYPEIEFALTGHAELRCDAGWISEALRNILKNSCEHTAPKGRITVTLETAERSITVTVEDSGGGIPEEEVPRLFRRFYRSGTPTPGGGAGLGLAIARTIVEKHHGLISAENTARGLQITLCFPRLDGIKKIG